ncbi:MAG: beta-ketoacyl synthase N-terminal-like domain-containing protein [bacterium]|nr:beta-ketoacyl synthase N-terminal-like domain-containing protein [bacterium]
MVFIGGLGFSKITFNAIGLALKDAGMNCQSIPGQDIGIIGTNTSGCVNSDIDYLNNYLNAGRNSYQKKLFIHTMPSSFLSESAIYYKFQGPVFYMTMLDRSLAGAVKIASNMIELGEASIMLAGSSEEENSLYFVLGRGASFPRGIVCDIGKAEFIFNRNLNFPEMAEEFQKIRKEKN